LTAFSLVLHRPHHLFTLVLGLVLVVCGLVLAQPPQPVMAQEITITDADGTADLTMPDTDAGLDTTLGAVMPFATTRNRCWQMPGALSGALRAR
jgi:Flp pilus assembly protein protease CpaA